MNEKKQTRTISYRISGAEDLVHHFSPNGYELLSDEFTGYLNRIWPETENADRLRLEIEGCKLSEAEKSAAFRALRTYYILQLSETEKRFRKGILKVCWFILSMILSAGLLLLVESDTEELVVQFAYLPIWFFGYRILSDVILEFPGIRRERKRLKMLSEMTVSICGTEFSEIIQNKNTFVRDYFMEGSTAALECVIQTPEEMIMPGSRKEQELITEEFASYLELPVPFLEKESVVSLSIGGTSISEAELQRIRNGIRNHFRLRIKEIDWEIQDNKRTIGCFAVGMAAAGLLLLLIGKRLNAAYHEIILILFWFFADYFVEFVLLSPGVLRKQKSRMIKMLGMEIERKKEDGQTDFGQQ